MPKVVLVGDSTAGKTSLVWRGQNRQGELDTFPPTVLRAEDLLVEVDGEKVSLQVHDTAGQGDLDMLRPLAYPGTDVFLLLCSYDDQTTLVNMRFKWDPEVNHYKSRGTKKVMVVNKCDLVGQGEADLQLDENMINQAKKELKMDRLFLVSAKTGEGVEDLFKEVAKLSKKTVERPRCPLL